MTFEQVTDGVVTVAQALVLVVLFGGWLVSYRVPKAPVIGDSTWFRMPVWAQISVGLAVSAVGGVISAALWRPIVAVEAPAAALLLRIGGLALVLGGSALFLWARRTLGAYYSPSTVAAVQLNAKHRLIQHGPFAIVRHPIYLSLVLILLGLLVLYRTWMPLLAATGIAAVLVKRAQREDQVLEEKFGAEWRAYASRVPSFVPFQRRRRSASR
jgi:protein-S-isoprenylcysteine O-methyltransferase Ste14